MAGFTEGSLSKKLEDLNASQHSIQTLSLWVIHHRKHYQLIVKTWMKELQKADEGRQITLMYLANDVIQNSKKKGPEYGKEFGTVMKQAFQIMGGPKLSEKTKKSLLRLISIWEERSVYDRKLIEELKYAFDHGMPGNATSPPPRKKSKIDRESPAVVDKKKERLKEKRRTQEEEVEVDGMKEVHITLSPRTPVGDPPEPEELIKALVDLENSASSDAAVRERIASLPPEVSEINLLTKLDDKAAAERLSIEVNEAVALLTDYNSRLASEMDDRKKVTQMLRDFIQAQRDLLQQAEQRLDDYKEKLSKVLLVRQEVKSHLRNLPDLSLPTGTNPLKPLPSAGDLFSLR
ncbi:regulation of nuclear pre-mRNA domain-containing protein 1B [Nilaparvata lugens]|uniref:regulation of nuclear pre-mRNA domain-containing protein 1B n=1 Tax=Nilaparvata lugens TaxID=108931 RepID=UPI00193D4A31|nr:regulation of nuclear pre-mRNA domain-containing protein 1B [Nilaparvata lugens]